MNYEILMPLITHHLSLIFHNSYFLFHISSLFPVFYFIFHNSYFIFQLIIPISYFLIIVCYTWWFSRLQPFSSNKPPEKFTNFCIIIPARDEEQNIGKCLQSIFENNYPLASFEVIVIDDHSTDDTPNIVASFKNKYNNVRLLKMAELLNGQQLNSYKKKAIEMAIAHTQAEWIITTDADCIAGKHWLKTYNEFISYNETVFIAAPVSFIDTGSFISKFQCLDFLSLQGITAASVSAGVHSLCNGANLCYKKSAFEQVGGFSGVDKFASGDDMFLMYKILKQFPRQVKYLFSENAIVQTLPMPNWKQFLNQRIRWASKASGYEDKRIIVVLALVYLFNLSFPVLFIAGFWNMVLWKYLLLFLLIKYVVELTFMYPVAKFYRQKNLLKWFAVMQPFHIVYTLFAGALGKMGKYKWKGREVN